MTTAAQRAAFLEELGRLWDTELDLRFGQFLLAALSFDLSTTGPPSYMDDALFYWPDDEVLRLLRGFVALRREWRAQRTQGSGST